MGSACKRSGDLCGTSTRICLPTGRATVVPTGYSKLKAGLDLLANTVPVYQIPGSVHCHTSGDEFYSRVVQDQALYQWIGQLLDASKPDPSSVQPTEEDILGELYPKLKVVP